MDNPEAAHLLGVAESEVIDVKAEAGWWHALHHDMASHVETWRIVPGGSGVGVDGPSSAGEESAAVPGSAHEQPERDSGVEGSPESGSGEVPDGPAKDVLAWVGDDSDRAVAALEAEELRDQPRTTLVAALEKVIG